MSYHRSLIAKLQQNGHWLVSGSPTSITLTKTFGKKTRKVVSVILEKEKDNTYTLAPIDYAYRSSISHFDYAGEEHRWARNKGFIKSLTTTLKAVGMWDFVKNKNTFIQVNENNPKAKKAAIRDELKTIL